MEVFVYVLMMGPLVLLSLGAVIAVDAWQGYRALRLAYRERTQDCEYWRGRALAAESGVSDGNNGESCYLCGWHGEGLVRDAGLTACGWCARERL